MGRRRFGAAVINVNEGPRLIGGSDGSFFVGGRFDRIGPGVAASNAARHTAAGWQALGTGVRSADLYSPSVQVLQRLGDRLFVGRDFESRRGVKSIAITAT